MIAHRGSASRAAASVSRFAALLLVASAGALGASPASPPIAGVSFAPTAGASLPLGAEFVDEHGHRLRLGDYVRSRPALLVPAYYGCSNLCGVALSALASSLATAGLHAGGAFDVVVFSINPLDAPADALARKRALLGEVSSRANADGWHFLTGTEPAITALADALGYRYAYDVVDRQYAHAAGVAVVAPRGRIVRVLYGVGFPRRALERALAEATAAGSDPASTSDDGPRTWLLCFHYDPRTGRYTLAALAAVRAAGLLALLALAGYVARQAWRGRRLRRETGRDAMR
jgi:protein SCO1/2